MSAINGNSGTAGSAVATGGSNDSIAGPLILAGTLILGAVGVALAAQNDWKLGPLDLNFLRGRVQAPDPDDRDTDTSEPSGLPVASTTSTVATPILNPDSEASSSSSSRLIEAEPTVVVSPQRFIPSDFRISSIKDISPLDGDILLGYGGVVRVNQAEWDCLHQWSPMDSIYINKEGTEIRNATRKEVLQVMKNPMAEVQDQCLVKTQYYCQISSVRVHPKPVLVINYGDSEQTLTEENFPKGVGSFFVNRSAGDPLRLCIRPDGTRFLKDAFDGTLSGEVLELTFPEVKQAPETVETDHTED